MTPEQLVIVRQEFEKHATEQAYNITVDDDGEYVSIRTNEFWHGYMLGIGDIFATSRIVAVAQSRIIALENFARFVLDGIRHKAIKAKPFLTPDNKVGTLKEAAESLLK